MSIRCSRENNDLNCQIRLARVILARVYQVRFCITVKAIALAMQSYRVQHEKHSNLFLFEMKLRPMLYGILAPICGIAVIYILILAFVFFRQTGLIHIPYADLVATPAEIGLEYEDVLLQTADQGDLHGWYIPYPNSRHTVLIFHGNAGNISYLMETYELLHDLGLSVLTYDYRTYGRSGGKLTEDAMYQDAEAMFDYLVDKRRIASGQIILHGRSLGTAMASWVATRRSPAGLIMESSFTSMSNLARVHYSLLPTTPLLRWKYDSLSRIDLVSCPVLYIHSRSDTLTPFGQAQQLFDATRSNKKFVEISGTHSTGFITDQDRYVGALEEFIDSLGR